MKEEKFNEIVTKNSERIKRICRYYNSNIHDQEDMYQEVLMNIWKSLDNFRGESAISTWIYRIAVNISLTYTGKTFKNMELCINTSTHNLTEIVDEDFVENKQNKERQIDALQQELNLLSVIDKALISLLLEGLSMKEIASVIGITEANVKVKLHRIKTELRNNLKEINYEKE